MKVTAADISDQFELLISGRSSREAVEHWAGLRMRAEDEGRLQYEPASDEERLWDAIKYLLGVGLRVAPNTYLHSVEDFEEYRRTTGL